MNTIANSFSAYAPLDPGLKEIRVLVLHAGPESAEICCSLVHTSLATETHREYEAVSYCWGDTKDPESITLDDRSFAITQSAGSALRVFRRENEDRVVWLDAICINQQDDHERASQVSIMKDIYKAATRALVWLGEDDDGAFGLAYRLMVALALQFLDQIRNRKGEVDKEALRRAIWDLEWNSTLASAEVLTHDIPSYDSPEWDALERFFCRPWFTRLWVVQEIVLSQKPVAFCGHREVEWIIITCAASWITRQRYHGSSGRFGLSRTKNVQMVWLFAQKSSLEILLIMTRDFQATDPRDRVFALLGLATDCRDSIPAALELSYLKSTSHVYSDATRHMIRSSQSLAVLSHVGYVAPFETPHEEPSRRPFPSWVPRWDLGGPETLEDCFNTVAWGRRENSYWASGGLSVALDTIQRDHDTLILQGMRIDKIKSLSSRITARELAKTDLVDSIWKDHASKLETYPTGEKLLRAFSLTMVVDATLNKEPACNDPQHDRDFALYRFERGRAFNEMGKDPRTLFLNISGGDAERYGAAAANATIGRSFCTTEAGWMGICPPTAREGDLVCLLFGGKVLYTIRRERQYSTFLGECYVHGRMDGSALKDQLETLAPAEAFTLR
jgi:hypothetical protein